MSDAEHSERDAFSRFVGARRGRTADTPLARLRAVVDQVSAITGEDAGRLGSEELEWMPAEHARRLRERAQATFPGAWEQGWARATSRVRREADAGQLRRALADAMVAALLADELRLEERRALMTPWRTLGRD